MSALSRTLLAVVAGALLALGLTACGQTSFLEGAGEVAPAAYAERWETTPVGAYTLGTAACEMQRDRGSPPSAIGVSMSDSLRGAAGYEMTQLEGTEFAEYALEHCEELLGDPAIQAQVREFRDGR